MRCNKCNQEIPDNSKFCLHCGAKDEVVDGIICPKCGYKNPIDARFCTECCYNIIDNYQKSSNNTNKTTTNNQSMQSRVFYEDLIVKYMNGFWGIVNKYDISVLPFEYSMIGTLNDNRAVVKNSQGLYGYIDKQAKLIIPCQYSSAAGFIRNKALVKQDNKFGYIDTNGNTLISIIYDQIEERIPNYYIVKLCGTYGIIKGKEFVVPLSYDKIDFRIDAFRLFKKGKVELFKIV